MQGFVCIEETCAIFQNTSQIVIGIASVFLALLFGLFVAIMFCDQMQCILGNTSTIDKLQEKRGMTDSFKGKAASSRTSWQNVKEVFGGDFNIWWFFPTEIPR